MNREEFVLPSGRTIELREMTGIDEKTLIDRALIKNGRHLDIAISNCITKIDGQEIDKKEAENIF